MNCFIDVETGGLDPHKNGILQLAAIIQDGDTRHTFNQFVKPMSNDVIEDKALKANHLNPMEDKFKNPWSVYRDFKDFLKRFVNPYDKTQKLHFVAYNSPFDSSFIRAFFEKNGDKFYGSFFWYPDICIMRQAAVFLRKERRNLPNFRLETLARYLNIEHEGDLHDALVDIELSMKVWKRVR